MPLNGALAPQKQAATSDHPQEAFIPKSLNFLLLCIVTCCKLLHYTSSEYCWSTVLLPPIFYTVCHPSELQCGPTLVYSGFTKRCYFADPEDARLKRMMSSDMIILEVPIEAFAGTSVSFTPLENEKDLWWNRSPVLVNRLKKNN